MPAVESLLLPITFFTLGINAFVLLQCLVGNSPHQRFLALFFFATLVNYLDDVFWLTDGWQWLPALTNVYIPFAYLLPVALYLYIQSLIKPHVKLNILNPHWLGFVFALFCCLPYYGLDTATKLDRLTSAAGTLSHQGLVTWGPTVALMLFIPFGLFYIILSLRSLKNNHTRVKAFFSNIEDKTLSWVRWAILILMLAWLVASIELILPNHISENSYWAIGFAVFELLWMWVFAHFAWQQEALSTPLIDDLKKQPEFSAHSKYQRSPLTNHEVGQIKTALSNAMNQQLHRQTELSLQTLSEHLNIPVNKLSQVLNVHMDTGFYDYINKNRITDACKQLQKTNLNIIDVAFLVGFNSKSTFNSAFKKHIGLTPSQYKKQNLNKG